MSLKNHSAPGPAAGYAFQFERALFWLASSPAGFVVGIETEDDVAIKNDNGQLILEQNKHSVQENATPFGDRSKDLWNTLSIWVSAVEAGEINVDSTKFLLVTNKVIPDCIARKISNSNSDEEAEECLKALREAAKDPSETILSYTETVLKTAYEETLKGIIIKSELIDKTEGSAESELRESTIAELPIPAGFTNSADSILNELHGWVQQQVLSLWQRRKPAWISRDNFVTQLYAVLERRKRQETRERAAHLIPVVDEELGHEKGRNFVKQIYLVTDEDWRVKESIRQFIRCRIEKNRLSAEGNITDDDWINFEDTLQNRWQMISSSVRRLHKDAEEDDVGFRILSETADEHRETLAGVETEQIYLTAGTYHRMADRLTVGWHPRYKDLMKEEKNDE